MKDALSKAGVATWDQARALTPVAGKGGCEEEPVLASNSQKKERTQESEKGGSDHELAVLVDDEDLAWAPKAGEEEPRGERATWTRKGKLPLGSLMSPDSLLKA